MDKTNNNGRSSGFVASDMRTATTGDDISECSESGSSSSKYLKVQEDDDTFSEEGESDVYESDYEYIDDSDTEHDDFNNSGQEVYTEKIRYGDSLPESSNSSSSLKRKSDSQRSLEGMATSSVVNPKRAKIAACSPTSVTKPLTSVYVSSSLTVDPLNLKTTGLTSSPNALTTVTSNTSSRSEPLETCPCCNQEEHGPVSDCQIVKAWSRLCRDKTCGVLAVDPSCIMLCMDRYIRNYHQKVTGEIQKMCAKDQTNPNEEAGKDVSTAQHEHDLSLLAVELCRNQWDISRLKDSHIGEGDQRPSRESSDFNTTIQLLQFKDGKSSNPNGNKILPDKTVDSALDHPSTRENKQTCGICMSSLSSDTRMFAMECGHEFCAECWTSFIRHSLEDAQAYGGGLTAIIHCPEATCKHKMTRRHVQQVAPSFQPFYKKLMLQSFVQGHGSTMRWCPGPDCGHVIVSAREGLFPYNKSSTSRSSVGQDDGNVVCDACKTQFCFHCGEDPHYHNNGGFNKQVAQAQMNAIVCPRILSLKPEVTKENIHALLSERPGQRGDKEIRRCPRCRVPIEKNGGCDSMICRCKHNFNWKRAGSMSLDTFGGNVSEDMESYRMDLDFVRATMQEQLQASRESNTNQAGNEGAQCRTTLLHSTLERANELERFAHCYSSFRAHHQEQKLTEARWWCRKSSGGFSHPQNTAIQYTKKLSHQRLVTTSDLQSCSDTETRYLIHQRLVTSRRILKYSFCHLFYRKKGDFLPPVGQRQGDGDLFAMHVERLKRFADQLALYGEGNDIVGAPGAIERVIDLINAIDRCLQAITDVASEDHIVFYRGS